MIIAIDGTSGSGKSTIAKTLAKKLNFGFFSAGSLYRAITHHALALGIDETEDDQLENLLENIKIKYTYNGEKNVMEVNGIDITSQLHDERISENVAKYACKPFVREFVKKMQQETPLHNKNIIMEGRDIGSVIFPDADFKVYVDCKVETRAQRRFNDISSTDPNLTYEKVLEDLKDRDFRDVTREISPLIMCKDAYLLDTTATPLNACINLLIHEMTLRGLISNEELREKGIEY